jgi:hypothetical protein
MEETTLLEGPRPDDERVFGWRFDVLVYAGYTPGPALALAEASYVDLHVALDLLKGGCPPETALRILL